MITLRAVERYWQNGEYAKLLGDLSAARPEAGVARMLQSTSPKLASAALALIRLEELGQESAKLCRQLIRTILLAQSPSDGGWDDPLLTSMCLKALSCCHGDGQAISRGMLYLASLQRPDGLWPREPIRRMQSDSRVSAWIMYALGNDPRFQAVVRFDDPSEWFSLNRSHLENDAANLWDLASLRLGIARNQMAVRASTSLPRSAAA